MYQISKPGRWLPIRMPIFLTSVMEPVRETCYFAFPSFLTTFFLTVDIFPVTNWQKSVQLTISLVWKNSFVLWFEGKQDNRINIQVYIS